MPKTQWTVAEAKAKFSEVLDRARSSGPQTITRNAQLAAVIVSAEEKNGSVRPAASETSRNSLPPRLYAIPICNWNE